MFENLFIVVMNYYINNLFNINMKESLNTF